MSDKKESKDKKSIAKAVFKVPSPATQANAILVGYIVMLLSSLVSAGYIIWFYPLFWKIISIVSALGLILVLGSNILITYLQLKSIKMAQDPNKLLEELFGNITNSKDNLVTTSGDKSNSKPTRVRKKKATDVKSQPSSDSETKEILNKDFTKELVDKIEVKDDTK